MAIKKTKPTSTPIVPIPECENQVLIDNAPSWARYFAQDANGKGYYYSSLPKLDKIEACWTKGDAEDTSDNVDSAWCVGWERSLVRLPNARLTELLADPKNITLKDVPLLIATINKLREERE